MPNRATFVDRGAYFFTALYMKKVVTDGRIPDPSGGVKRGPQSPLSP